MAFWLILGLLLAAVFLGAVFRGRILVATGLDVQGGAATISPTLFPLPTTPVPEPEEGLPGMALPVAGGITPDRKALEAKISALDTKLLVEAQDEDDKNKKPKKATRAYQVIDVASGKVVGASKSGALLIPASNTKTLTVVAAMNIFQGDETFATTVVQPEPGRIVLVGGGDAQLVSAKPKRGTYPRNASTQELAELTAAALTQAGIDKVTLGYDASLFEDSGWADTWPGNYRDQVTQLSALWVDEGRTNGGRSRTAALDAATIFAEQLGKEGITVSGKPTEEKGSGEELARVESTPVHVQVEQAMQRSNNSFTEVLGFQLALATGHPATFDGSVAAIEEQLTELGIWDDGAELHDASGLSRQNKVSAAMLTQAMAHIVQSPRLSVILEGLPVAGVTGTLATRFDDDTSRGARGVARAKTGTLSLVATLSGTTTTDDGAVLAYAFMVNGAPNGWAAKVWTDQAVGAITACGC
ncbi:D-alanyl-D-alanine carboxypeptidase/D-alanyl-D-alanine endopeptidase [Tessaracoccus caeni]|uniref:D-alanyl-D-alanine carboxypeptidase/D-alanyl-D-alanine endopeptidase n=1 Tax=Tessaracoccus caeni TaxID=3031239 RepID=UPI0023D9890F|nr:D-alanyl-D-alanine carboxypeptidase/D-alanyl-D-alanine-endopeptidase [Tessaracoccus caeni]MDF1487721.1 D-alanyl-D-alanine carboxypeptidase/D-alanyl-D-alanine-endopeptidase [Tessaracoccus caeni]